MASAAASSPAGVEAYLLEVTKCPICLEDLSDPRQLPCQHTFCLHCIEKLCEDLSPGDAVECPLCRREFAIPSEGIEHLPRNSFISALLRVRRTSFDHLRSGYCEQHNEPVKMFCAECRRSICTVCFAVKHRQHECRELECAADELRAEIRAKIGSLSDQLSDAGAEKRRATEDLEKFKKGVIQMRADIQQRGDRLKMSIDQHVEELLNQVDELDLEARMGMKEYMNTVDQRLTFLDGYIQYASEVSQQGLPTDIISVAVDIEVAADELLTAPRKTTVCQLPIMSFIAAEGAVELGNLSVEKQPISREGDNSSDSEEPTCEEGPSAECGDNSEPALYDNVTGTDANLYDSPHGRPPWTLLPASKSRDKKKKTGFRNPFKRSPAKSDGGSSLRPLPAPPGELKASSFDGDNTYRPSLRSRVATTRQKLSQQTHEYYNVLRRRSEPKKEVAAAQQNSTFYYATIPTASTDVIAPSYSTNPELQSSIDIGDIAGIARCHGKLFVVQSKSDRIVVYGPNNDKLCDIVVDALREPRDIVACSQTGQLYIAEWCDSPSRESGCVWRVTRDGRATKWLPNTSSLSTSRSDMRSQSFSPNALSLTSGRLLVTSLSDDLFLYGSDGVELNCVSAPDVRKLTHAVETSRETFIAAHLHPQPTISEVCPAGRVLREFCDVQQMHLPRYLALDSAGRVLVADLSRILLLDGRSLQPVQVLLDPVKHQLVHGLSRLCLDEESNYTTDSYFIVASSGTMKDCIQVFRAC